MGGKIYCATCQSDVDARLTSGAEIYPHRPDLARLPFWRCDPCGNYVGCHHKTRNRTAPLGCIPTPEMREGRQAIHAKIDPLWRSGRLSRKEVYERMSQAVGWNFHTSKTRSMGEVSKALRAAQAIAAEEEK